jgi:methionyl-tRNA formyltransferase
MFATLSRHWQVRGFTPVDVVIDAGAWSLRRLVSRLRRRRDDSAAICRRLGWPYSTVAAINDPAAVSLVTRLAPDLAVNAGAGILRGPILNVPRIGTLGAHMGLLPAYRGMNVAEWATLNGDAVGCSVFWIDEGIDTGDIAEARPVDVRDCRSVAALRGRVSDAQLELLADVSMTVVERGSKAFPTAQRADAGRQFYRMHGELLAILEQRLASGDVPVQRRNS